MNAKAKANRTNTPKELTLSWSLAELPSSQHRAGLAGLVMMIAYLQETGRAEGLCQVVSCTANLAEIHLNQQGLAALFDVTYAAATEETARKQPFKKNKVVIEPKRIDEIEVEGAKGKTKLERRYVYDVVVPDGAFLADDDRSGDQRLWLKLWQNMVWSILRGVPATRTPFEQRVPDPNVKPAERKRPSDAAKVWKQLSGKPDESVDLPSTYFIGAQAATAESVPFRDRARYQFLLHFWPYACQVYVPTIVDNEGKSKFSGFVLAVPDVARLDAFCGCFRSMLAKRGGEKRGYRPKDAVVELPAQSALELSRWLATGIEHSTSSDMLGIVLGIDTLHLEKRGNNITLLGADRVVPTVHLLEDYALARELRDVRFKRQVLRNILDGETRRHVGFDRLLCTVPYDQTLESPDFRRDARTLFQQRETLMEDDDKPDLETIIYQFVRSYVLRRLEAKHQIDWRRDVQPLKDKNDKRFEAKEAEYNKLKRKIALDAFLAARSRGADDDFIEFFASTLASVPQRLGEDRYLTLSKALRDRTQDVRTLTMLALCANA